MRVFLATSIALALSSTGHAQQMDPAKDGHHMDHGGMAMPGGNPPSDPPMPMDHSMHAGDSMPPSSDPAPMDHSMHSGHAMPSPSAGKGNGAAAPSGHGMAGGHMHHGPVPGDPPHKPVDGRALTGPAHAADLSYDPAVMAKARANMIREHGEMTFAKVMLDRLETKIVDGKDGYAWEGDLWTGNDIDKLWIKSEGEGSFDAAPEQVEVQALWSHAIGPWFDVQLGARHDFRPNPDRTYGVVGVRGLLPYWLEVDGALFLSQKGDVTARGEVEYDLRITPKLILQPRAEVNLAAQNVPEIGVGAGLTQAELGLRLRYHVTQQFAPYVGVQWESAFGRTRRYLRAEGEDPSRAAVVLGLRAWF
ncbi:copper resistance protein B [Sphingobium subterraneum]|uniref:Copper resistance protein B n=1 Tax=Sphingobium subterraneum TaxID=627688 RepID=A0A841IXS9_9SPHN|nr:copper resistance protein B [Sphingobium subterraneum]MBB6123427.1 copper resistance protein B [Sphingobium subterraneum]